VRLTNQATMLKFPDRQAASGELEGLDKSRRVIFGLGYNEWGADRIVNRAWKVFGESLSPEAFREGMDDYLRRQDMDPRDVDKICDAMVQELFG
jgi:hypothetical protein